MKITEITTESEASALIEDLNRHLPFVVLDLETTGLNPRVDKITDIVIGGVEEDTAHILRPSLTPTLANLRIPLVCHNFKFDFHFLSKVGITPKLHADTMLLDHLIDENIEHGLDAIVQRHFQDPYKAEFWGKYENYSDAPREDQVQYAGKDVIYTRKVFSTQMKEISAQNIPAELVQHVHDLALALYATEVRGLGLDLNYLNAMGIDLSTKIVALKQQLRTELGTQILYLENMQYLDELDKRKTDKGKAGVKRPEFNFDSPIQLSKLLYGRLKLPPQLNKARKPTLDDKALEALEPMHSSIATLREYRGHQKVFTAFIEASLERMEAGRIYPSFNINGTVTGRISSSNPNMQQLPRDGGVRGIYVPDPGHLFVSADYSSLEVVLAAHLSQDPSLLSVVFEGKSLHDITAEGLGIPRQLAKGVNFCVQYGGGPKKISQILNCSSFEAEAAFRKYWETYPGLAKFIAECHSKVENGEPLRTMYGRIRHFPATFEDKWAMERAKRQAANSVIQGLGADITSRAFYLTHKALKAKGLGYTVLPVHDEILIGAKKAHCEEASELLVSIMEGVGKELKLTVPLKAECGKPGERWSK